MRLLITDVTEMHEGNYCVAGWDIQLSRMVRPLPDGNNWTSGLLQQHGVVPGALIDVKPNGQPHSSAYPHRTEDMPVARNTIQHVGAGSFDWFGPDAPPSHAAVEDAFGGHLRNTGIWNGARKGAHVAEATQIGSLSAVIVPLEQIDLFEDNYQGQRSLRAYLTDNVACYNLPVVARNIREAYRLSGLAAAQTTLPTVRSVHVRLGLARAWPAQPGKCSLMINGIYG